MDHLNVEELCKVGALLLAAGPALVGVVEEWCSGVVLAGIWKEKPLLFSVLLGGLWETRGRAAKQQPVMRSAGFLRPTSISRVLVTDSRC